MPSPQQICPASGDCHVANCSCDDILFLMHLTSQGWLWSKRNEGSRKKGGLDNSRNILGFCMQPRAVCCSERRRETSFHRTWQMHPWKIFDSTITEDDPGNMEPSPESEAWLIKSPIWWHAMQGQLLQRLYLRCILQDALEERKSFSYCCWSLQPLCTDEVFSFAQALSNTKVLVPDLSVASSEVLRRVHISGC